MHTTNTIVPFYRTIDCSEEPRTTSRVEDVRTVRLENGFVLPPTYQEWARVFGYGETFRILLLQVPLTQSHPDSLPGWSAGMKEFFHEGLTNGYFEFEPDGSPDLVSRLVPFGISIDGHYFAWDPADPTHDGECRIYAIGSKMWSVRRAGDDLADFLAACCDERVKRVLGPGYTPLLPTFKPLSLRW